MDELLQRALERRDALRKELEAVESFLHAYAAVVAPKVAPESRQQDLFAPRVSPRAQRRAALDRLIGEAERLILEANRPLTRGQLLEKLEAAGFNVEGGDKSKVLGTNLWRSKRFLTLEKGGYWPVSTPLPPPFHEEAIRTNPLGN